ncbi:hypothetical protein HO173_004144 [Letharia columbiana]|uniref:Uncharacterized protein n=1 Tax=Letharia columbiana TaxID=112416 RepID=A0A8H6G010_9LECA|nr:uncharacterized protein HO173_004144 [Letharia columbiana]KAF6237943.1 hypothetical protein HO173_004144 [Letharia columbiana]
MVKKAAHVLAIFVGKHGYDTGIQRLQYNQDGFDSPQLAAILQQNNVGPPKLFVKEKKGFGKAFGSYMKGAFSWNADSCALENVDRIKCMA